MIFLIFAYTISFGLLLGLSYFVIFSYSKSKKILENIDRKK
ncbi:putative membrane protein [Ehrlichia cf. muris str. EmCRT]|uniref:Putative membrane protein n=1 Tax=Ehrlichia cf. muris str. EmCRT TaxID=1359167 RepID=A0A0F3NDR6_9RICK|nr:putative membrane protein [Ehrlichia cf. muris str. EmCRT]